MSEILAWVTIAAAVGLPLLANYCAWRLKGRPGATSGRPIAGGPSPVPGQRLATARVARWNPRLDTALACRLLKLSPLYEKPFAFALMVQVPYSLCSVVIMDGGHMLPLCELALAGFWAGALLILARRPRNPTPGDLAFVRWGFLGLVLLIPVLAALLGRYL